MSDQSMPVRRTTWRDATRNRIAFNALRALRCITALQLRDHLKDELRSLVRWDEPEPDHGRLLIDAFPPPHDKTFWQYIEHAEHLEEQTGSTDANRIAQDSLRRACEAGVLTREIATQWQGAASQLFAMRMLLRQGGEEQFARLSDERRKVWEEGHDYCPRKKGPVHERDHVCGLSTMVHADGAREVWVQEAISRLQLEQLSYRPTERARVAEILKEVAKRLAASGRGRSRERAPAESERRRRDSTRASKYAKCALRRAERLADHVRDTLDDPKQFIKNAAERELLDSTSRLPADMQRRAYQSLSRRLSRDRPKRQLRRLRKT